MLGRNSQPGQYAFVPYPNISSCSEQRRRLSLRMDVKQIHFLYSESITACISVGYQLSTPPRGLLSDVGPFFDNFTRELRYQYYKDYQIFDQLELLVNNKTP